MAFFVRCFLMCIYAHAMLACSVDRILLRCMSIVGCCKNTKASCDSNEDDSEKGQDFSYDNDVSANRYAYYAQLPYDELNRVLYSPNRQVTAVEPAINHRGKQFIRLSVKKKNNKTRHYTELHEEVWQQQRAKIKRTCK